MLYARGERKAVGAPQGQDVQAVRKQSSLLVIPVKPKHVLGVGSAKALGSSDTEVPLWHVYIQAAT